MILTQILQPDCIKVPVENRDKEAVITELVDLLDAKGLLLDRNSALEADLCLMKSSGKSLKKSPPPMRFMSF
jgi:mannitol/fructose-specific phosphotransferase system IIA component (Ntr-type)